MDSNSGSMQSSSGGDEEYDSRAADSSSISAFMNPSLTHVGAMANPPRLPPPSHLHSHHHSTQILSPMFDPSVSAGYSFQNQNPLLNLDMLMWSKTLRSDPNCTDPPNIFPSSSSPPIQRGTTAFRNSSAAAVQIPSMMPENAVRPSAASSEQTSTNTGPGSGPAVVRNTKKRSRASRRAPTTVLTTDTTNFRAMVQEFTGIPAPPFTTSSSPFPRTRLDLFSSSMMMMKSTHLLDPSSTPPPPPPQPPYLLRPFAQKIQPPPPQPQPLPFVSSSNTITTTAINSTNMTSSNSTSINYQLPVVNSDLGQVNMHNNPMLSFQSLLQTSKYPLPNSNNMFGSRPPNDEYSLSHGHVNSHLPAVSNMEGTAASRRSNISNTNNNPPNWGGNNGVGSNDNEVGDHEGLLLRSVNGNYNNPQQQQQRVTINGKANYLASSSSNFHGDRGGSENVSTRSEGMVESWICSSD